MVGAVLDGGCVAMLCAGVKVGRVLWAAETTATVCIGTLWTAVVVNSRRTGPVVGVNGVDNLAVVAFVTTLVAMYFKSDPANTDCGTLCRFSLMLTRVLPALAFTTGKELTVDAREIPMVIGTVFLSTVFIPMAVCTLWMETVAAEVTVVATLMVDVAGTRCSSIRAEWGREVGSWEIVCDL